MAKQPMKMKKNDWILYAYIIQHLGGETSLEELKARLAAWKKRGANSRRISQVMARKKSKGFQKVGEKRVSVEAGYSVFTSIWAFNGDIPEINKRTKQNWDEKLSPKGDKPKF